MSVPDVPVTFTVYVPAGVLDKVVRVRVDVTLGCVPRRPRGVGMTTGLEEKLQAAPVGSPEQLTATLPLKELMGLTETVSVAGLP